MKVTKKNSLSVGLLIVIFCVGSMNILTAQSDFWKSKNAYLGQKQPGDSPEIFGKGVLVDSGIVLGRVSFSADGKQFYYGVARHWFDMSGNAINQITFDGKKWARPQKLFEQLSYPTLSVDGEKLYLGGNSSSVWVSDKQINGWGKPYEWLNKNFGIYNFHDTKSGLFYAGSDAGKGSKKEYSTYDFCTLTISGKDTIIQSLGSPLNTPAFDGDFFIAADESYIIISAKETPTYECELWISFRKSDNTWTEPVSLGDKINDGLAHRFGQYVSPDGKYLFYTRGTGEADCNIYWVRFDGLLDKLKPKEMK